jgi:hypothetical protein
MELSGHLHALEASLQCPLERRLGDLRQIQTLWRREIFLVYARNRTAIF